MNDPQQQHGSVLYLAGVCLVASLGGLLFGFDTAVISGTVERVTSQFDLSEVKQGWFTLHGIKTGDRVEMALPTVLNIR